MHTGVLHRVPKSWIYILQKFLIIKNRSINRNKRMSGIRHWTTTNDSVSLEKKLIDLSGNEIRSRAGANRANPRLSPNFPRARRQVKEQFRSWGKGNTKNRAPVLSARCMYTLNGRKFRVFFFVAWIRILSLCPAWEWFTGNANPSNESTPAEILTSWRGSAPRGGRWISAYGCPRAKLSTLLCAFRLTTDNVFILWPGMFTACQLHYPVLLLPVWLPFVTTGFFSGVGWRT